LPIRVNTESRIPREFDEGLCALADARAVNHGLAADNQGRLFAATPEGKFVCLDAATGEQRFVILGQGAKPCRIEIYDEKYVLAYGKVFSAQDGKVLATVPQVGLPRGANHIS